MKPEPRHARMGEKQGRHAAQRPQRRHPIGTGGGDKGQTSKDKTEVPQREHLGISKARTHFRKAGQPAGEVEVSITQSMIHGHLLNDEQYHPHAEIDFGQDDGNEVGVDQTLFHVGRKGEQPEVGSQHGDTRNGR